MAATKRRRQQELSSAFLELGLNTSSLTKVISVIREKKVTEHETTRLAARHNLEYDRKQFFKLVGDAEPIDLALTEELNRTLQFPWYIVDVAKFINQAAQKHAGYRELLSQLYEKRPCTPDQPWRYFLSFDEFVPGAVLNLDNRRKSWTWLLGIVEFGTALLSHYGAWVPIGVIRSKVVKLVKGGLSNIGGGMIRRFERLKVGFPVTLAQGPVLICLAFDGTLADGAAEQYFWNSMGAAGVLPCFRCLNVVGMDEDEENVLAHDESRRIVDISSNDIGAFLKASVKERCQQADILANLDGRAITREAFTEVQRSYGIGFNLDGVLAMRDLRPTIENCSVRKDAMHCIFQHGICEHEFNYLLRFLKSTIRVTILDLAVVARAGWKCPFNNGKMLDGLFTMERKKHFDRTGLFSCSASEMIMLVPLVLYFLETIPLCAERLPLQLASWRALEWLTRLALRAKHGMGSAGAFSDAIKAHGEAYAAAYGEEDQPYIPKFHWTKHLPEQYHEDEVLYDCFPAERANLVYKNAADSMKNTSGKLPSTWETSVSERVWIAHHQYLGLLRVDGVIDGTVAPELGDGVLVSLKCTSHGCALQADDIVFLSPLRPFRVDAFCESPSGLYYVGEHLEFVEQKTTGTAYYKPSNELVLVKKPERMKVAPMHSNELRGVLVFDA